MAIRKFFLLLCAFSVISEAYADVRLVLPSTLGEDACQNLPGSWSGEGKTSTTVFSCHYKGSAFVMKDTDPTRYKIHLDLRTDSHWPCSDGVVDLPASCNNNQVVILMTGVDLNGSIEGNWVRFKDGTVSIGGVTAKIDYITLAKM